MEKEIQKALDAFMDGFGDLDMSPRVMRFAWLPKMVHGRKHSKGGFVWLRNYYIDKKDGLNYRHMRSLDSMKGHDGVCTIYRPKPYIEEDPRKPTRREC